MTTNKIEIKDLTVNYTENKRSFNALTNVSFDVADGEFVSVIGASIKDLDDIIVLGP